MLLQEDKGRHQLHKGGWPCPALPCTPIGQQLPPDFDIVGQQPAVDGFGGVSHEGAALEAGLLQEPGQSTAVVQVEADGASASAHTQAHTGLSTINNNPEP